MMSRVLIVEDEPRLLDSLSRGVAGEGYEVSGAGNLWDAQRALATGPFAAVILDLMLPDGSGLDWLKKLRKEERELPVLIMTARDLVEDRILGLDSGADDYVVKPCDLGELIARLRALIRRSRPASNSLLTVGDLEVNLVERRAWRRNEEITLTRRQLDLLICLMRFAGETVSRETIAKHVWKEPTATWTNVIEVQINHLRRRIERPGWPPLLQTIRGEGYLLETST